MARPTKDARDLAAQEEVAEKLPVESLSAMIADALTAQTAGPAHGALSAIETSLIDLKRRAESVSEHLGESPILERIKAL